jgi:glycosyltransferase involved in cell wall biosynthesis
MLNVLLDVNVLGRGLGAEVSRAGIFRATEGFIRAMMRRNDADVRFTAEATWANELLLQAYNRDFGGLLGDRIVRAWRQPSIDDAEATKLIEAVVAAEAAGQDVRRDRAKLTLLAATAKRQPIPFAVDVLHSLRTPLPKRDRVPARARALTIHDLIPLRFPEWMYATAEAEMRQVTDSILQDDFVIANSKATAADVAELLQIPEERIFVTPFAASRELFRPERSKSEIARVRAKYNVPDGPYLLSVCTLEPRKNLMHLVRCFADVLHQEKLRDIRLVLVGATGWKTEPLFQLLESDPMLKSRVVLAGYVADEDLAALYSDARAFAYPSLYEGFGLPVLEAMQCGTPVVTSNVSSLPEVVGDAGLTVAPTDGDALKDALLKLIANDALAAEYSRKGLERAQTFSWDATADAAVAAYHTMLEGR